MSFLHCTLCARLLGLTGGLPSFKLQLTWCLAAGYLATWMHHMLFFQC